MKRSIALLIVLTMLLTLALIGCGSTTADDTTKAASSVTQEATAASETTAAPAAFDPSKFPITICMPMKGHPVHQIMEIGFISEAKKLGYPITLTGIDDLNQPNYIAACEAGITNGVKGMLIYAWDPFIYPTIKKISDAGIIVVTHHTNIAEGVAPGISVNCGGDPVAYSKNAGKVLAETLAGKKGSVIVTQGSFNTAENECEAAFEEAFKAAAPDIKILKPQEEGFDAPKAIAKAVAIIQGNPDLIGVYGVTGGSAGTWAKAKEQTNNKDLVVFGVDYTEENLDLIRSGAISGVVAQPLFTETQKCMELLDKMLRGEKVPYRTNLDAPMVTKANLAEFDALLAMVKEEAAKIK